MERRLLGTTGVEVATIGQGTWEMEDSRASAIAALRRGLDLGMTHIDTAEMYGSGAVEEIVGQAIAGRRDEVFLASKVLPGNASYEGTLGACERSLRRLKTDRIDLYLLHWPGDHPFEETLRAFETLEGSGKIRFFGVSNFDDDDLDHACSVAGKGRIACNQVLYHLGERAIEHAIIPWCERHGVAVVGYSPFGSGDFPSPESAGGKVLAAIAARHGATARQVALAFLARRPSVVLIPKAARVAHVEDNAGASGLVLEAADLAEIERAFPLGPARPGVPTI